MRRLPFHCPPLSRLLLTAKNLKNLNFDSVCISIHTVVERDTPVSYTHLDVYKRQDEKTTTVRWLSPLLPARRRPSAAAFLQVM